MKIATFNINNINRRLPNLLEWLRTGRPDVVCLQELKAAQTAFPAAALSEAGYHAVWQGQPSWNGVAILARGSDPVVTRRALPGNASDTQSRYIEAAVAGVLIGCIYLPNGNPQPGPKFDYKLAWFDRLIDGRYLLVSVMAGFERSISERIRGTKAAQKAGREYLGGPVPFGFTYDAERKLLPIPEQQQAIERMQELHAQGLSLRKIAAELANDGHRLSHMSAANILAARSAA